jgi:pilus assembly protein FimV
MIAEPQQHQMKILAGMMAGLGMSVVAHAELGSIRVISSPGEPFAAEIYLDSTALDQATVGLADRNKYDAIAPYSSSAANLRFSLHQSKDGSQRVIVTGPADIQEANLRFAVQLNTPSGRLIREYELTPRNMAPKPFDPQQENKDKEDVALSSKSDKKFGTAMALGEIHVESYLGDPLYATVELYGSDLRRSNLNIRVEVDGQVQDLSPDLRKALSKIKYRVDRHSQDQYTIKVRSTQPIHEPILPLKVIVAHGQQSAEKRYTVFLDLKPSQNKISALPVPKQAHLDAASAMQYVDEQHKNKKTGLPARKIQVEKKAKSHVQTVTKFSNESLSYLTIKTGETLTGIAKRLRSNLSLEKTMDYLLQNNPQAFVNDDPSKMLAGKVLKYPSTWSLHGSPLESRLTKKSRAKPGASTESADGSKISPVLDALSDKKDTLSKSISPESANSDVMPRLDKKPNQLISPPAVSESLPLSGDKKSPKGLLAPPSQSVKAQEEIKLRQQLQEQDHLITQTEDKIKQIEAQIDSQVVKKEEPQQESSVLDALAPIVDFIKEEPLKAGAAAAALGAIPLVMAYRRRRNAQANEEDEEISTSFSAAAITAAFAATMSPITTASTTHPYDGQTVTPMTTLNAYSTLKGIFTEQPNYAEPANMMPTNYAEPANMMPMSRMMSSQSTSQIFKEVDVYVMYGRYDQGEEALKEALHAEPMRQDLRMKLLEVIAAQFKKEKFINQAEIALGMFGEDHPLWAQICEIGRQLAPDHDLFQTDKHMS